MITFNYLVVLSQNKENETISKLKEIIYTFADDSMLGRAAGGEGEEKAKNYLINYFKEIGLAPIKSSYIQEFTFPKDSIHIDTAYNLIGFIDNKADSTIIIGAHYDHLGMGGAKSRSLTNNKIHNGADDNASGVAVMLMLAEYLNNSKLNKFNYVFIAFSAHEEGLFGSEYFVSEKTPGQIGASYELNRVKLFINLDMVGRLDTINPMLKVMRNNREKYLDSVLYKLTKNEFNLIITEDNTQTDATVFINNNITSVTFTTGTHDDYHKVSDDAEKINYEGINEIIKYVENLLFE